MRYFLRINTCVGLIAFAVLIACSSNKNNSQAKANQKQRKIASFNHGLIDNKAAQILEKNGLYTQERYDRLKNKKTHLNLVRNSNSSRVVNTQLTKLDTILSRLGCSDFDEKLSKFLFYFPFRSVSLAQKEELTVALDKKIEVVCSENKNVEKRKLCVAELLKSSSGLFSMAAQKPEDKDREFLKIRSSSINTKVKKLASVKCEDTKNFVKNSKKKISEEASISKQDIAVRVKDKEIVLSTVNTKTEKPKLISKARLKLPKIRNGRLDSKYDPLHAAKDYVKKNPILVQKYLDNKDKKEAAIKLKPEPEVEVVSESTPQVKSKPKTTHDSVAQPEIKTEVAKVAEVKDSSELKKVKPASIQNTVPAAPKVSQIKDIETNSDGEEAPDGHITAASADELNDVAHNTSNSSKQHKPKPTVSVVGNNGSVLRRPAFTQLLAKTSVSSKAPNKDGWFLGNYVNVYNYLKKNKGVSSVLNASAKQMGETCPAWGKFVDKVGDSAETLSVKRDIRASILAVQALVAAKFESSFKSNITADGGSSQGQFQVEAGKNNCNYSKETLMRDPYKNAECYLKIMNKRLAKNRTVLDYNKYPSKYKSSGGYPLDVNGKKVIGSSDYAIKRMIHYYKGRRTYAAQKFLVGIYRALPVCEVNKKYWDNREIYFRRKISSIDYDLKSLVPKGKLRGTSISVKDAFKLD